MNFEKTSEYRKLKRSLTASLEARGLTQAHYRDKVQEYLAFWVRRRQLQADIEENGLREEDERGRIHENRSVSLEIQVSRQMLAIFQALGFKQEDLKGSTGDDDDL